MLRACPRLWVSSALRTRAEQQRLYTAYLDGTGAPANRPGTSMHERGLAVDVGAHSTDDRIRRELAKQYGLVVPHVVEPWHMELNPNRAPLTIPQPTPAAAVKEEEMPRFSSEYRWPDGCAVQVFSDGAVKCFGAKSFGSMHSLKDEFKRSFTRAECVRPVDTQNSRAGYIVGSENGDEYTFNEDAQRFFKRG